MFSNLINELKKDTTNWNKLRKLFVEKEFPARTVLLREGEIAGFVYYVIKGSLRLWFNNDGKDITFQFFFENQAVSSFESFFELQPSMFTLETIEPAALLMLSKKDSDILVQSYPQLKDIFLNLVMKRMGNYSRLFLSRIKDNPQQRYEELVKTHPEIILRVPQHQIASYLGITPVSLSRIRNKKGTSFLNNC